MNVLLTGAPGSGKSTVAAAVARALRARGLRLAGLSTPEVREHGERTGFRIEDLATGESRLMASTQFPGPPRVGKYGVDVDAIDELVSLFESSLASADALVIDEIGKMELHSDRFTDAVEQAFASGKPIVAVVHRSLADEYESYGRLLHVTRERAPALVQEVLDLITAG